MTASRCLDPDRRKQQRDETRKTPIKKGEKRKLKAVKKVEESGRPPRKKKQPKPTATATAIARCGLPVSQPSIIDMFHSVSKSEASRPHYMYIPPIPCTC